MLEATCEYSGNKQKVRVRVILESVSTLCIKLNCENCKELADHPFQPKS